MFYRYVWKKLSSLERRAFLLSELEDLKAKGRDYPTKMRRSALRSPSAIEDYINFLRFLDPAETVQLIDIGANCGDWCGAFLDYFPNTRVIAIEPAKETYARLEKKFTSDSRVRCLRAGASKQSGTATLHVGQDSTLNSFEQYAEKFANDRAMTPQRSEEVPLVRVDDVVEIDSTATKRVLKIDVQGHEVDALSGAGATLSHVDVALCELSFVNEYVGVAPSFPAVTGLMLQAGLYPVIFQDYGTTLSNHRVECDVVYVRDTLFQNLYLKG